MFRYRSGKEFGAEFVGVGTAPMEYDPCLFVSF